MLWSLLYGSFIFTISLIIYFTYKYVIKPYFLLQFYKKQDIQTLFLPFFGDSIKRQEDIHKHRDYHYSDKQKALQTPRPKAWGVTGGDTVAIFLKDHGLVKNFYLNHDQFYEKYLPSLPFHKELMGSGVLLSEGALWKKHRRLASAAFNFESLKEMIPEVTKISTEFLDRLKNTKDLSKVDMLQAIQTITGEIVGRIFFGEEFSQYEVNGVNITKYLTDLIVEISIEEYQVHNWVLGESLVRAGILPSHRNILKKINEFRAAIKKIAVQRLEDLEKEQKEGIKEGRKRINLMELFYKQRKDNPTEAFTEDELVDEFITFFIGGTDTTGHVITMASYWLLKHPEFKDQLLQEINENFSNISNVSIDTLNKMDYVTAFIKETLRITPIGGALFHRVAKVDHDLGGLVIKKGTIVNLAFLSNNYDADCHEDPYTFNPQRWLEESQTKKNVHQNPFIYTPFSAGTRNCIGQHLAMNEARIILSLFVKTFDYELADKDYVLRMAQRLLYEPYEPICYILRAK